MPNVKYLIVGAGLAGSTCAFLLKRAGADVTLLERLEFDAKSKLCAGLVTPRAMRKLVDIFGSFPEGLVKSRFDSMRCIAAGRTVDLQGIAMSSVERAELDAFALHAFVDLGGRVIDGFHIRDIDFANKRLTGIRNASEELSLSYDVLIAADGALSYVRRKLTGGAPDSILSLEAIAPNCGAPLTMCCDEGFFGYSWYAPAGDSAKIGCCAYGAGHDLEHKLCELAESLGVTYAKRRGAFIPTGSDVLLEHDGVYFLGDAASLICPPSGEGIFYALLSAKCLATALTEGISYSTLMRRHLLLIKRQYLTRGLFYNASFIKHGIDLADATPYGAQRAVKFALRHFTGFN